MKKLCFISLAFWCLTGCLGRDQATGAVNAGACIERSAKAGSLNEDQIHLLSGAVAELEAIHQTLDPSARASVDLTASPKEMGRQAQEHARTIRTLPAQGASWIWQTGLAVLSTILGGGAAWGLARRATGPVLASALEFGQMALDRLRQANPSMVRELLAEAKENQNEKGTREKIRTLLRKAGKHGEAKPGGNR